MGTVLPVLNVQCSSRSRQMTMADCAVYYDLHKFLREPEMSKMPLFFIIVVAVIVVAASFRFVQQRREKMDNDAAPLMQKRVVVTNKREKVLNDRRSRQQTVTPAGSDMRYDVS